MKISIAIILCFSAISNPLHALNLYDSNEEKEARTDNEPTKPLINSDPGIKRNVRRAIQNDRNDTKSETTEYSATANACQKYSKEISNSTSGSENFKDEILNEFPWMAALGYYFRNNRVSFLCNGIVISDLYVLTVAHCVKNIQPVIVRLGRSSLADEYADSFLIQEIIQHPYYEDSQKKNDIALIQLSPRIHFSNSIRPACLETDVNDLDEATLVTEIGWGRRVNRSEELLKINLQTMPLSQCNEAYLDYNKDRNLDTLRDGISESQYCAYDLNFTKESCGISSGGALLTFPPNSLLPNIIGISSFATQDYCSDKHPEVFTRVAHYIPWIEPIVWPFDRRGLDVKIRADFNAVNSTEDISLIAASQNGYEQIVSLLILNGANVNEIMDGETALHVAAAAGHEKVARLLIHNGADYTVENKEGKVASDLATDNGFPELARVLQKNVAQKACDTYSNLPVITTRIIGGEFVHSANEFPWMAALGYLDSNLRVSFNCGGTLISDKFILTAAHCVKNNNPPIAVRLGQVYLNNTEDERIIENHHIRQFIRHPDYSFIKKINDIALIELVNPVYFSEFIRPACLQTYLSDENPTQNLTITGWGIVSPKWRNTSNALLKANLKTVPLSQCNTTFFNHARSRNWTSFRNGLDQSHYCAADPNRMSDACEGDSGGALQIIRPYFDLSTVVGIVSTGLPCGTSFPGIYTRVAYFVDWIESHVWPNGDIAQPLINPAL